jgi:hypothetical protein
MTRMRKQVLQEGRTQGDVQAPGKCTVRRVQNTHFGMYSGTWVWYDTTSGIASSLAYRMEPNTSRPAIREAAQQVSYCFIRRQAVVSSGGRPASWRADSRHCQQFQEAAPGHALERGHCSCVPVTAELHDSIVLSQTFGGRLCCSAAALQVNQSDSRRCVSPVSAAPGEEAWMTWGRVMMRCHSTRMDTPQLSSSVGAGYHGNWKPRTLNTCRNGADPYLSAEEQACNGYCALCCQLHRNTGLMLPWSAVERLAAPIGCLCCQPHRIICDTQPHAALESGVAPGRRGILWAAGGRA